MEYHTLYKLVTITPWLLYRAEITTAIHLYRRLCEAQKLSGRLGEWTDLFPYRNSNHGSSVVPPAT